ncbi:hypothetical protein FEK35_01060 [Nocardia cyriacigeorgica]|uniref:Uncharacterized protein n=1 Tax=Nocardia cyriacigeorgica TaxID=135487 RepID=A0A5R8PKM3_9NOCA|nr:hypothetical protein [Nocardia cyriacigeorgica]TLG17780.1 hypothetical protein FEK35_01060 [Nocardia cyriacigeorgica]
MSPVSECAKIGLVARAATGFGPAGVVLVVVRLVVVLRAEVDGGREAVVGLDEYDVVGEGL